MSTVRTSWSLNTLQEQTIMEAKPSQAVLVRAFYVRGQSLDFRVEELLRTRGAHVRLGDEADAGIDMGRYLFTFRGGERSLHSIITHAERVLDNERCDRAVLQEFDELIIPVEADKIDRVPGLVRLALGHGFGRPLR